MKAWAAPYTHSLQVPIARDGAAAHITGQPVLASRLWKSTCTGMQVLWADTRVSRMELGDKEGLG